MKLISLNTWGGLVGREKLLEFFNQHKDSIDIFCLQEIWSAPYEQLEGKAIGPIELRNDKIMTNGLQDISRVLSNHTPYFRPHFMDHYGLLIFVNNNFQVVEEGEIFVYKEKGWVGEHNVGDHGRNLQYITINTPKGNRTILNLHGLWNGGGKGDSEDRLKQSDNIIRFAKDLNHPFVLTGDFNLLPDTESLKKFEDFGLRNLIKENKVTSTRSSFYTKEHKFADYAFVSNRIRVNDFKVLPDEVSDHLAMYLDFE